MIEVVRYIDSEHQEWDMQQFSMDRRETRRERTVTSAKTMREQTGSHENEKHIQKMVAVFRSRQN